MIDMKKKSLALLAIFTLLVSVSIVRSQTFDPRLLGDMRWRSLGPANFSGRIVDVEALDRDFRYVIVASASGGVWKSVNAGITWEPIFDHYTTASIGDIAIFQKDPNIIWVGTGEANNRNDVGWGDGIYKSVDGGKTFRNVGLRNTFQIARVVTHPTDSDIVYVAAVGDLWGDSGDRGLFKTTDGGKTWTKLTDGLPNDGKTGAIDLVMDPSDPNTLYVAFYQRLRKPYRFESGGPNGGIFKTTDGGKTWVKLTRGLPEGDTGRIGLAIYRKDPRVVMAIIEHGYQPKEDDPGYYDMKRLGTGVYRSEDGGETWTFVNRYNNRPFYYSQIRINPLDDDRVYVLTTTMMLSEDGGKTFHPAGPSFEGGLDYHAMWLDPTNKDRYYLGKDKGLTLTQDGGESFVLFDNLPVGQFYAIGVDMREPYYVYGGTQDNGTWGGPNFSKDVRGILNDSWWKLHWGDGMFIQIDPTNWRKVYTEAENGSFRRYDAETRRVEFSRPSPKNIVNYRQYVAAREGKTPERLPGTFRFNWRAPLVMSSHNPQILYLGGNYLFKTVDGGRHWRIISPDLSTNDPVKTKRESGGLTIDTTGAEVHCTITAISESPLNPSLIWVGTDDGNVQITRDGGVTWTNVRPNIPGVPEGIWVSSVEASRFDEGTCYVTFDGHMSDNFSTWIFKTEDYGKTWVRITNNIPDGQSMFVVREDPVNKNLLFAGSEFACFASVDGGQSWFRLMNDMPTVEIRDLVIHPRDHDLIAGTHGRAIWIMDDITPLEQLSDSVLAADAFLFRNRPATLWEDHTRGGVRGEMFFAGENPPYVPKRKNIVRAKLVVGGLINFYLKATPRNPVVFEISDITGLNKRTMSVSGHPGINRALWDLRFDPTPKQTRKFVEQLNKILEKVSRLPRLTAAQKSTAQEARRVLRARPSDQALNQIFDKLRERFGSMRVFRRDFRRGRLQGKQVPPGEYRITMTVDGRAYTGKITVRKDPMLF